jgi:hypothetical protein
VDDLQNNRVAWQDKPAGNRLILPVIVLGLIAIGVTYYVTSRNKTASAAVSAVTATSGRLTLAQDDGGTLAEVNRQDKPEVWYRVNLTNVPLGKALSLDCEWIDPTGKIAHQNHYTTKEIKKEPWPTHARCQLRADSPPGTWTVKMSLAGRVLHSLTFVVKDAAAPLPPADGSF